METNDICISLIKIYYKKSCSIKKPSGLEVFHYAHVRISLRQVIKNISNAYQSLLFEDSVGTPVQPLHQGNVWKAVEP